MPLPNLVIRRDQMSVFEEPRERAFEARLSDYLGRSWPPGAVALDDSARLGFAIRAIRGARAMDISVERDVALFALLWVCFGEGFESDPRYPWANEIVEDSSLSGTHKVAFLQESAANHYRQTDGMHRKGDT